MSDPFRETYIVEANELLTELEAGLLQLEETPADKDTVGRIFGPCIPSRAPGRWWAGMKLRHSLTR